MTQVQNTIMTLHPSTFIFTVLNTGKHNLFPNPDYLALETRSKIFLKSKSNLPKGTPVTGQKHFLSPTSPESGRTTVAETSKTVQIPLDCHPPVHLCSIHCSTATQTYIKKENIMQIQETRAEAQNLSLLSYTSCQNSMSDFVLG